jgi:hypothetical protein
VSNTVATTYLVRDDGGHAVCIDCGYASTFPINCNPHRYIDKEPTQNNRFNYFEKWCILLE